MRNTLSAGLLLVVGVFAAQAQDVDLNSFFPLQEGNTWTYYYVLHPPSGPDTSFVTRTLVEAVERDGNRYFEYDGWYIRSDGEGRIYAYHEEGQQGRVALLFDFTVPVGESYVYRLSDGLLYQVTVSEEVVETEIGTFDKARILSFDIPEFADEEFRFGFIEGIGPITRRVSWEAPQFIFEAVINGETVTETEIHVLPEAMPLRVYPNPFAQHATIEFEASEASAVRVTVHDVLGRRLQVLQDGFVPAGLRHFSWDGRDEQGRAVTTGIYFIRMERAGQVSTQSIVRAG